MSWDDEFDAVVKAASNPTPTETAQPSVDLSDFEDGAAQYDFTAADFTPDQPEAPEHDANYLAPPFDLGGIDLLSPPGFAGDITAWIDSRCRYPRRRLAVASAMVTLGNIGGLSHEDSRDGVTANMLAFCVAASATGKEAVQQAMADLHRAAGLHYAMQGGIKSEQEITRNLIEHQAAFYVIDEIGIFLQKVKNAQKRGSAAYLEGVFGMIMSVYSKANSRYLLNGDLKRDLRKVYAAAVAKSEDEGEDNEHAARMLKMVDEGLERPFLSLVGYTTPSTFDTVIDGESATQGFIGRAIMIQEKGINPEARAKVNKAEVPRGIAARLTQLFHGGSYDMSAGYGGRIEHNGDRIRVETTQEASDMLLQVISWLHRYADERGEDTGEAAVAIIRRAYEMIAKISFILAIPTRERTAEHVRWAFAYVRQELDAKIALVFANDNSKGINALSATAARIIGYIDSDQGTSASVIANRMKMARDEVEKVLVQMEGGGMVYRETSKRKYKGKAVEVWKVKEQ